jgi:hypothetical protein
MEMSEKYPEKLSGISREYPFGVPESYFDNFYAKLEGNLNTAQPEPTRVLHIYHYLKPVFAIAASIALIFLLLYWPIGTFGPRNAAKLAQSENVSFDDVYYSMVSALDENSFLAVLSEPEKKEKMSDDDIASYVNATFSDYEIYVESNKPTK